MRGIARKRSWCCSQPRRTALSQAQCSPYGVQWTATYALSRGTATAVVNEGSKRWFILASDYAFGKQRRRHRDRRQSQRREVVGTVFHPPQTHRTLPPSCFRPGDQSANRATANAGGDTIGAISKPRNSGIGGARQLAAMLLLITDVHSLGLQAAQKTYLTVPSYWDMVDGTRALYEKFEARVGRPPTFPAGEASTARCAASREGGR